MTREELIQHYQRKIAQTRAEMAQWQAKIDSASPDTTNQQIGVWRGKVWECRRSIKALQRRIRLKKIQ
jgi:hypothetical protein